MSRSPELLSVRELCVSYPDRRRGGREPVRAVAGVDLTLAPGEILGLVGESGSGKSSLARALVGVVPVASGRVLLEGRDLTAWRAVDPRGAARRIQMVFQDAGGALDPRQRVGSALREVLALHGRATPEEATDRVNALLARVGLDEEHAGRLPHQLSGGQRQRVGIARALAVEPDILVLDEPVSALDVSVQARILELLERLRAGLGLSLLFIAHDLAVVRNVCDRVAVLYRGRVVEEAPTGRLFSHPRHPYTLELLASASDPDAIAGPLSPPSQGKGHPATGSPPGGCPYFDRCGHRARDAACTVEVPALREGEHRHQVACVKES